MDASIVGHLQYIDHHLYVGNEKLLQEIRNFDTSKFEIRGVNSVEKL